ncbi:4a-hydroxytetrahydrobiopterin dehydratase, partial [Streptomyces sp. SID3343]|uniref:4a-hydroxytetrahydrobiopterin dehydratase n=1 Tax=Streptomyces sp. SID3343 TaxID=2690260 RepID=UPI00136C6AAE|nr:hypothetical protein [Streptomyces sp. SID3343]
MGDAIERTRAYLRAYRETLHVAVYVGATAREIRHHPDIHITWQRIRFGSMTPDARRPTPDARCPMPDAR